ncbi:MAG: SAM-dependent methyltransferase [Gemmatimonadota bacterium]
MDGNWLPGITPSREVPAGIDTSVAHSARVYDYILGGKDNFEADRKAAEAALAAQPHLATAMRENRALMRRMVAFLAAEAGVRQFLDIGTGLPTSPNVHEIAGAEHPGARVVYVDNDPIVLAHARALLTCGGDGATAYIDADAREPGRILADPRLRGTLDLSEPVALLLFGILHFIPDAADPYGIVATLLAALPPGSYLAIQHPTADFYPEGGGAATAYGNAGIPFRYRTRDEFSRFLDGLDLVPPGITLMAEWRPAAGSDPRPAPEQAAGWAAIARKAALPAGDG